MGIEPTPPAWKAGALPLSYARMFRVLFNLPAMSSAQIEVDLVGRCLFEWER